MSLESSLLAIAEALNNIALSLKGSETNALNEKVEVPEKEIDVILMNMDEAGVPSKFKMTCSICGELGRNSRTCKPTKVGGSYHWLEASK